MILDFWTYCYINCIHTLPDLDWMEKRYKGKLVVVIGVHSAKFNNEQDAEHIRNMFVKAERGAQYLTT